MVKTYKNLFRLLLLVDEGKLPLQISKEEICYPYTRQLTVDYSQKTTYKYSLLYV